MSERTEEGTAVAAAKPPVAADYSDHSADVSWSG